MIIPVKCFTCGKVLADIYRFYKDEVKKLNSNNEFGVDNIIYIQKIIQIKQLMVKF